MRRQFTSWRTLRSLSSMLLTSPTSSLVEIKLIVSFLISHRHIVCLGAFYSMYSHMYALPNSLIWAFIKDDAFITGRGGRSGQACSFTDLNINQTLWPSWKVGWSWLSLWWLQPWWCWNTSLPSFSSGRVFSSLQLSRLQQKPINCDQNEIASHLFDNLISAFHMSLFSVLYLCFLCLRQCPFNLAASNSSLSDCCCINTGADQSQLTSSFLERRRSNEEDNCNKAISLMQQF